MNEYKMEKLQNEWILWSIWRQQKDSQIRKDLRMTTKESVKLSVVR